MPEARSAGFQACCVADFPPSRRAKAPLRRDGGQVGRPSTKPLRSRDWKPAIQQTRKSALRFGNDKHKLGLILAAGLLSAGAAHCLGADAKVLFIAGKPSHGPGEHEHRAGCLLLKSCLDRVPGVKSVVCSNGWPEHPDSALAGAATVVVYSDGGEGHPLLQADHLKVIDGLMKRGVGLVCLHYAVEPTKEKGEKEFLDWLGGCFEVNRSVNPFWKAQFKRLPEHPITRGVEPFEMADEWYFYMRFRDGMEGVTPILTAIPPASTMSRPDGPHEGNPAVREAVKREEPQYMAWAFTRPDGGRGFGFTGGHSFQNWGNDNFRKLVLNAILWTAHVEVPPQGVPSHVSAAELKQNLDAKTF